MTDRVETDGRAVDKTEQERERAELGLSKNQYKKLLKQRKHDETKEDFRRAKREKRKEKRAEKRKLSQVEGAQDSEEKRQKKYKVEDQKKTGVTCIIDCDFDELMNEREIRSMSNQISRMYSAKRSCPYELHLAIESFNKRLKEQFDTRVHQYTAWKNIDFHEESVLDKLPEEDKNDYIYLTADTDEVIEELEEGKKYIIGGIVDKNRHKNLCVNKAKKLGVRVGRLPIDKYIKINGRQVLATSHVYEILCKWFEFKDWGKAFNAILPQRKIKHAGNGGAREDEAEEGEEREDEAEEIEEGEEDDDEVEEEEKKEEEPKQKEDE